MQRGPVDKPQLLSTSVIAYDGAFLARHKYPRELANRVFDIMTIQKATATLLMDGVSIILTAVMGLLLLAFYHPFLLGFDLILLMCMISITWVLGRGGIRTAIKGPQCMSVLTNRTIRE